MFRIENYIQCLITISYEHDNDLQYHTFKAKSQSAIDLSSVIILKKLHCPINSYSSK